MKENIVRERIQYLQQQIMIYITTRNLLDDKERAVMLRNIENLMAQSNKEVTDMVSEELSTTYTQSLKTAKSLLSEQGVELSTNLNSMVFARQLDNILQDTMLDLNAAYRTANNRLINNIEQTVDKVKQDIADGTMYGETRKKTVKKVYDDFAEKGLSSFTTVDGKELPLDFYAETVTRTKMRTANVEAHTSAYQEAGVDLVEVTGASDPCGQCAPYIGVVFSTNGQDDRFPHEDVRNIIPVHPNCRCNVIPYVIEYMEDEEIQEKINKSQNFDPNVDTRTQSQKDKYKEIQDKRRIARQEVKQYDKIKGVLGSEAPKNIGAYRRMKRNNTKGYQELQARMRQLN